MLVAQGVFQLSDVSNLAHIEQYLIFHAQHDMLTLLFLTITTCCSGGRYLYKIGPEEKYQISAFRNTRILFGPGGSKI